MSGQALFGLGLVVDGPRRGELGWVRPPLQCGSVDVVVDPPVLDGHSGFEELVELPAVEQHVAGPAVD